MHLYANDSLDPTQTQELRIMLVDSASSPAVFRLDVDGEEGVFFECDPADPLDVIESAFEARKRLKEDLHG